MKNSDEAHIGDTICLDRDIVEPLPGFKPMKAMVSSESPYGPPAHGTGICRRLSIGEFGIQSIGRSHGQG